MAKRAEEIGRDGSPGAVVFPVVFPASGVQLAFVMLPRIFEEMGFGPLFGSAFFLLMFFAALTSAVSILELPVATLIDVWGLSRRWAAVAAPVVVMLLGLPSALSYTALRLGLFGTPLPWLRPGLDASNSMSPGGGRRHLREEART
jgi:NSS family neurotransmitter:Na+ symporter